MRKDTAKHFRAIHRALIQGRSEPQPIEVEPLYAYDHNPGQAKWTAIWLGVVFLICLCCNAHAYTDEQYVNAIYKAEGGSHAQYAYGIRSTSYKDRENARAICLRTVKHNRVRFQKYGYRTYPRFIEFLASRYCPTSGRSLSKSEKRLNQYWIKNVMFFLRRSS